MVCLVCRVCVVEKLNQMNQLDNRSHTNRMFIELPDVRCYNAEILQPDCA